MDLWPLDTPMGKTESIYWNIILFGKSCTIKVNSTVYSMFWGRKEYKIIPAQHRGSLQFKVSKIYNEESAKSHAWHAQTR